MLSIALVIISAVAFFKFGYSAIQAGKSFVEVGKLSHIASVRGTWVDGTVALSLERSVLQVMLASDLPISDEFAKLRDKQRAISAEYFEHVDEKLTDLHDVPSKAAFEAGKGTAMAEVKKLRADIDAMIALPLSQRDAKRSKELILRLKSQIADMKSLGDGIVLDARLASLTANTLTRIQDRAWELREFGGRARTHYVIATHLNAKIPPDAVGAVAADMERANAAWADIERQTALIAVPENITAQIAAIETAYFGEYLKLIKVIDGDLAAAPAGAAQMTTVTFEQFYEASGAALETAAELAAISGEELVRYWQSRRAEQRNMLTFDILALGVLAASIGTTMYFISRRITSRLSVIVGDVQDLADGNLDGQITQNTRDLAEIAQVRTGLFTLQSRLKEAAQARAARARDEAALQQTVDALSEGLQRLSQGDLSFAIAPNAGEEHEKYQTLINDFNASAIALRRLVGHVIEAAGLIGSGTSDIAAATVDLSRRTEKQGATLDEAAQALKSITETVTTTAADAGVLETLAHDARTRAVETQDTMAQTVSAMNEIKSSSTQIVQIVDVIEDISFQTNLLALNAGVEATRAGDSGTGFAVIASEVRSLAERSAESAKAIKELITASGTQVSIGVTLVNQTEASVSDITERIQKISALISGIATGATAQSLGLQQVNQGISELDEVTASNAAMVEETTAQCLRLEGEAQDLSGIVQQFRIGESAAHGKGDTVDRSLGPIAA